MPYVDSATRSGQIVSAARAAMTRVGVGATSLRVVAAEAGVPLGTLQHVFPTKDLLFRAVFEDVVAEIESLGSRGTDVDSGLAVAIRTGLHAFWAELVSPNPGSQVMQLELIAHAVREPAAPGLAGWLYDRYLEVATNLCRRALAASGETSTVPVEQLGRLLVAGLDGLLVQHLCQADDDRARADLDVLASMLAHAAGVTERRAGSAR